MSKRKIAVKLTEAQWAAVVEAVSEWGGLTCSEAEMRDGGVIEEMNDRGRELEELATTIGIQVERLALKDTSL